MRRIVVRLSEADCASLDAAPIRDERGKPLSRSGLVRRIVAERIGTLGAVELPNRRVEPPALAEDDAPSTPRVTMAVRILAQMEASRDEVFDAAGLALAIGSKNRNSVRNKLGELAEQGAVERVSPGRYRAARSARPAEGATA
jgi:hypothetical protein